MDELVSLIIFPSKKVSLFVESPHGVEDVFPFQPGGLCRGTVEVGGVHFVAHGGDDLEQGDARFGEGVEEVVAAVAWLVDADVAAVT